MVGGTMGTGKWAWIKKKASEEDKAQERRIKGQAKGSKTLGIRDGGHGKNKVG